MRLPPATSAVEYCNVLLAFHAAAIARNLDCVFTSIDPEGPHQLRVALRRLRAVLRAFEPVMRRSVVAQLRGEARKIGLIVSELRDADVMIDEIIGPALADRHNLLAALDAWRQEVRGRVRARLIAMDAIGVAFSLTGAASSVDWRKKSSKAQETAALTLISQCVQHIWARMAPVIAELHAYEPVQVHDLRKDVKALRYVAEFGAGLAREDYAELALALKGVQDALGYVNDLDTLRRFSPSLVSEGEAVSRMCKQIATERAERMRVKLASAQAQLREISHAHALALRSDDASAVA